MSNEQIIRLHREDNVVVAMGQVKEGAAVEETIAAVTVPRGHKIATHPIAKGEAVTKYGQIIGFAADNIAPGEHVHSHNCMFDSFERDYAFGEGVIPVDMVPDRERLTFEGYKRANGQTGTRKRQTALDPTEISYVCDIYFCDANVSALRTPVVAARRCVNSFVFWFGCMWCTQGSNWPLGPRNR